jgi:hypothetical protein
MNNELKRAIVNWLLDNKNLSNKINLCTDTFRQYIYDNNGNYIICGKQVIDFITWYGIKNVREELKK